MKQEFDGTSVVCHFAEDLARHVSARPRDERRTGGVEPAQHTIVAPDRVASDEHTARRANDLTGESR